MALCCSCYKPLLPFFPPSLPPCLPPSFFLSLVQSKEKMKRGSRRAAIQLKGAIIGIDDEDDCTFTIRDQTRIFHFQGESRSLYHLGFSTVFVVHVQHMCTCFFWHLDLVVIAEPTCICLRHRKDIKYCFSSDPQHTLHSRDRCWATEQVVHVHSCDCFCRVSFISRNAACYNVRCINLEISHCVNGLYILVWLCMCSSKLWRKGEMGPGSWELHQEINPSPYSGDHPILII